MNDLIALLLALPILAAAVTLVTSASRRVQRAVTFATLIAVLIIALIVGSHVLRTGPVAVQVGGWPAGYAIPLVADALALSLLVVMSLLTIACVAFACITDEDADRRYLPLVMVVVGGVAGVLLTGDLFNLFVFFEVMLAGSYVLISIHRGSPRESIVYIVTSLLASTLLLAGVALLYGTAGTLHLGRLHGAGVDDAAAGLAGVLVLMALVVKSAAVPVHGWLPHAYPAAPAGVTALFSGVLTKASVYALLRVSSQLYDGQSLLGPLWATIAVLSMIVGVAGALGRTDVGGILSFHMVSQIGYLLVILVLIESTAAVAAGLFFLLQYIFVKGGLFLVAGVVEHTEGSAEVGAITGLARRSPATATVFAILALSLAGLPPVSGFVAKYLLAVAAFEAGAAAVGAALVVVSLFTLLSMLKIWNEVFWSEPADRREVRRSTAVLVAVPAGGSDDAGARHPMPTPRPIRLRLLTPAIALAAVTVVVGVGAAPILDIAEAAAAHLLDSSTYAEVTS